MGVIIARIDQRLVHGIVVTQWASTVKAKRIMVVDDVVAGDEARKAAMRMSKPAGTGMSLIDTETAIANFKAKKYDNHNVLLVVNNVQVLLDLVNNGVEIPKVNIGIMLDREDRKNMQKALPPRKKSCANLKNYLIRVFQYLINLHHQIKKNHYQNFYRYISFIE